MELVEAVAIPCYVEMRKRTRAEIEEYMMQVREEERVKQEKAKQKMQALREKAEHMMKALREENAANSGPEVG